MRIGIDISQLAYVDTGVGNYLENLIQNLLKIDKKNEYVFFFSSMRRTLDLSIFNSSQSPNVIIKTFKMPPALLSFMWNDLHVAPIEWFLGPLDIFITSDWTEPPTRKAKKATIIYDMSVFKTTAETHKKIVETQKRKLKLVKKESDLILCISESARKDIAEILDLPKNKVRVIYPGFSL